MSKWIKRLLGLAVIGSIVAGVVYYFQQDDSMDSDDYMDDFEDEDFDLDEDLKPVTDREYVPLNTPEQVGDAVSAATEKVEDVVEETKEDLKTDK